MRRHLPANRAGGGAIHGHVSGIALPLIGYVAAYIGLLVVRPAGDWYAPVVDFAFVPIGTAALALALAAGRRHRAARSAWAWLAGAFAAYLFGDLSWFVQVGLLGEPGTPSIADVGYLAFYPLLLVALLRLHSRKLRRTDRVRYWLDVSTVLVAAAMFVWFFALKDVAAAATEGSLPALIGLAYPVGDGVVLFACVAVLFRRLETISPAAVILLLLGVVLNAVADLAYAATTMSGVYESGGWMDVSYMVGWLSMALAADAERRRPAGHSRSEIRRATLSLLPYLAVAAGYGLLLSVVLGNWSDEIGWLVVGSMVLTGLVVARQVLAVRENLRLEAERVQLRSERRFRSLVQNASDLILILDRSGSIAYATPSAERVIGRDLAGLVGRRLPELIHPDDVELASAFLESAEDREESQHAAWKMSSGSGEWRDMEAVAANLTEDPTVAGLVITLRDVTERKRFEAQLAHQAFHDPLTGLANRALFGDRLGHALRKSARGGRSVTVLYLDIDDFKRVNDSLGHTAGDELLIEIGRRLEGSVRDSDTVARFGGDEFAILLEEADSDEAALSAVGRVARGLAFPFDLGQASLSVSASIGIARSQEGQGVGELLRNADIAMYTAKAEVKGGHRLFEPTMHAAAVSRIRLEADLGGALERGELSLAYQPIIDLRRMRVVSVEALLRWTHPERGQVPPSVFVPIAETTGQIRAIGGWVLDEASRQLAEWRRAPHARDLSVSVNLSARQLDDPQLPAQVAASLELARIPPEALTLELTESLLASESGSAVTALRALRRLGARVAIDDFGTGYSSLSYLQAFPIDVIKIDKSFVDGVARDGADPRLVRTIIQMGQALEMDTIAEGIERPEQLSRLRELGCRWGQGYLFAPPLDASGVNRMLAERSVKVVADRKVETAAAGAA